MSQTATLPAAAFNDDVPPALRVRGYWASVLHRLRHDPVTLFFGAIVVLIVLMRDLRPAAGAVRSVQGKCHSAAETVGL